MSIFAENAALDDRYGALDDRNQPNVRPSRFGLSQYTSKRLADLRARRAEMDQSDDSSSDFQQKRELREARESRSFTSRLGSSTDNKQDETPLRHNMDVCKTNNGKIEGTTTTSSSVSKPATRIATVSSTTGSVNIDMNSYRSRRADSTSDACNSPHKTLGAFDSNKSASKVDDHDHMDYRARRAASGMDVSKSGTENTGDRHRTEQTGYARSVTSSSFSDSTGKMADTRRDVRLGNASSLGDSAWKTTDTRRDVQSAMTSTVSNTYGSAAANNMNSVNTQQDSVSLTTTLLTITNLAASIQGDDLSHVCWQCYHVTGVDFSVGVNLYLTSKHAVIVLDSVEANMGGGCWSMSKFCSQYSRASSAHL